MNREERQNLGELLLNHQRRLYELEKRAALTGISTPPEVFIEIKDIQGKIALLQIQLEKESPTPDYGPVSGEIHHDPSSGVVQAFNSGKNFRNFIATVSIVNPFSVSVQHWNAAVLFRSGFRVWICSDKTWGCGYSLDSVWKRNHSGELDDILYLENEEANDIRLAVYEERGCFFVNSHFVAELNLGAILHSSDVSVGISERKYKREGAITRFRNFTLTRAQSLEC